MVLSEKTDGRKGENSVVESEKTRWLKMKKTRRLKVRENPEGLKVRKLGVVESERIWWLKG